MLAGHFAAAAAMKAKEPRVPTWALVVGVQLCDILFGIFVALGIEHMTKTPGEAAGVRLDFIDWSHSLLTTIVWAALFAALVSVAYGRGGRVVFAWVAVAVLSHFVLDVVMHPPDLALWPHSTMHVGLGLWRHRPLWWLVELAFIVACVGYYVARRRGRIGRWAAIGLGAIVVLHVVNSPWLGTK